MFLPASPVASVATQKVEAMVGQKLLIVEPLRVQEKDPKTPDRHGADVYHGRYRWRPVKDEVVMIVQGVERPLQHRSK